MQLYAAFAEPAVARQVDGLQSVASRPVVDRMPMAGPITFGRGLEIELTFEERGFDGGSAFVLGGVLEAFFRRYVALNSYARTVVRTVERGEIMRWPARVGQRQPDLSTELRDEAWRFDFFAALRLLECARPDAPRLGKAARARQEPLRLGQEPQLTFAAGSLASFVPAAAAPPALSVLLFGLFGSGGPLPLHLTAYAIDRRRQSGDDTFINFCDLLQHRLIALFYRA